jgi:hypothetical protein
MVCNQVVPAEDVRVGELIGAVEMAIYKHLDGWKDWFGGGGCAKVALTTCA